MADVFEAHDDLDSQRGRLWSLIGATPWLDWLLLTKRPENIGRLAPWGDAWPQNVWLGVSTEDHERVIARVPLLLHSPAVVRFLSVEPLLGPIDLDHYLSMPRGVDWVIAGGESGRGARPMNADWVRSVRDQTLRAGKAFFFKQWGEFGVDADGTGVIRLGKRRAGRTLDGREWNELPTPRQRGAWSMSDKKRPQVASSTQQSEMAQTSESFKERFLREYDELERKYPMDGKTVAPAETAAFENAVSRRLVDVVLPELIQGQRRVTALVAVLFDHIREHCLYELAGYKSMADYARECLDVRSEGAYKLYARAGRTVREHFPSPYAQIVETYTRGGQPVKPPAPESPLVEGANAGLTRALTDIIAEELPDLTTLAALPAALRATSENERPKILEGVKAGTLRRSQLKGMVKKAKEQALVGGPVGTPPETRPTKVEQQKSNPPTFGQSDSGKASEESRNAPSGATEGPAVAKPEEPLVADSARVSRVQPSPQQECLRCEDLANEICERLSKLAEKNPHAPPELRQASLKAQELRDYIVEKVTSRFDRRRLLLPVDDNYFCRCRGATDGASDPGEHGARRWSPTRRSAS